MMKIENVKRMENELGKYNPVDYTVPRLTMRYKRQLLPGLKIVYDQIREYQNIANDLFDTTEDENYIDTFIELIMMKLQKHISVKTEQKKKSGNEFNTFREQKG
jgi:hypothetical protein